MKANYLLGSLCLAPLALTAPVSHTVTLVAGKSVFQPGHKIATLFEEIQHVLVTKKSSSSSSSHKTHEESSPSIILDAERPLTTAELLALAQPPAPASQHLKSHKPSKSTKDGNKKISVGALVVPSPARAGGLKLSKILDPHTSPYLIPGQYVSSQRADVLIVGLILACVLVVVAMESWELICKLFSRITFMREGSIRLDSATDIEQGINDDSDDDCDAPFGGFRKSSVVKDKGLRLPEKVDEKAAWI
ncbi:hypothetical protein N0V82_004641 [Gnomoniopsis sp. IMI 355080]|nr:hypothetical protein N0V82_004641 [Gnomoniopsis sp. IMI 355080]